MVQRGEFHPTAERIGEILRQPMVVAQQEVRSFNVVATEVKNAVEIRF
jgi:hypothetical protein